MQSVKPLGSVGEIGDGGNEGFDFDGSGGDSLDGIGVLSGGGTATVDAQLPGDDCLEGEGDFGFEVADATDAAAFADGVDRDLDGGTESDDLHRDVGAIRIADEFADLGGHVVAGNEGVIGSELAGHRETFLVDVDRDDNSGPFGFQGLDYEESDESGPYDDGGVSFLQGDAVNAVEGNGDGFGEGGLFEADLVGDGIENVLGDFDEFGEGSVPPVVVAGDAEDVAVGAEVDLAVFAGFAFSAIDGGVEGDAVADVPIRDRVAGSDDFAGGFVSHDDGGNASTGAAVHAVDVGSADAAGLNGDEDFVGGDLRIGSVAVVELVVGGECEGFHGWKIGT